MPNDSKPPGLTGRNFRGQALSGSDFSHFDIRGVDFTNAVLRGANFSNARGGPRPIWLLFVVMGGLVGSVVASLITGYAGGLIGLLMFGDLELGIGWARSASVVFFIALALFLLFFIREGPGKSLGFLAVGTVVMVAVAVVGGPEGVAVAAIIPILALAMSVVAIIVWSLALSTVYLAYGRIVVVAVSVIALGCALPGALEGTLPANPDLQTSFTLSRVLALSLAGFVIAIVLASSVYIGGQVIAGNAKFSILSLLANTGISLRGTSFQGADLSDADFTGADLKGVDFRAATLTRTCFFGAKRLEQARTKGTYLDDLPIRQLVVEKDARESKFIESNLRGLNLRGASLQRADFTGSDLSEATLENANLSGAKLAKSRLYQTNLTRACLTAAVIQDWAISTDTIFNEVQCEFIYMKLPTEDDPDPWRKPDNRNETFQEGDFSDFIAPIIKTLDLYRQQNVDPRQFAGTLKTLDLYHYQGIDPVAAAVTLKQLAEEHPEAQLEVVALEGRGNEKIRLQAAVAEGVDRSQLSAKYAEKYQENSSLPRDELQELLGTIAAQDRHIASLEKMVMTAIQSDKFYVEANYNFGEVTYGDKTTVGNIEGSTGIAIGQASQATVNIEIAIEQLDPLFRQLQEAASQAPPEKRIEAQQAVQEIRAEMAKGQQGDDAKLATLIDQFVALAPAAMSPLLSTFSSPLLHKLTGPVTKYVLKKMKMNLEEEQ